MSRRIALEDFDGPAQQTTVRPEPQPQIDQDAIRSAAFEEGYKSGWDDCRAEHLNSEKALSSDLAQAMSDAGVTYRDARRDVLTAIKPLIETIVSQLLPKLASDGLAALVAQELMPLLQEASDLEPELFCAPKVAPIIQNLLQKREDLNFRIRQEPTFTGAQVLIRFGSEAREIDLSEAVAQIGSELETFTERLITDLPETQKGPTP